MSDDPHVSGVSNLFDQVVLPLGKTINSCFYKSFFNILMVFLNQEKKTEIMIRETSAGFDDTNSILLVPNYEEFVVK